MCPSQNQTADKIVRNFQADAYGKEESPGCSVQGPLGSSDRRGTDVKASAEPRGHLAPVLDSEAVTAG
jgi:hypothetical protein